MENLRIKSFDELSPAELLHIFMAREEVFYLEQHITEIDADQTDKQSVHIWAERDGKVIAYVRCIPRGAHFDEASFGRLLVLQPYRRTGLGNKMVKAAIRQITEVWGERAITISAQTYLVPYYRSVGFRCVGEPYNEAGIAHNKMIYKL